MRFDARAFMEACIIAGLMSWVTHLWLLSAIVGFIWYLLAEAERVNAKDIPRS